MTGVWLAIMILFIGELFFYTWCRVQCIQMGYDISEEVEEQRSLTSLHQNLKIELARLKSPARIEKIARQRLGLIAPSEEQIIVVP